MKNLIKNIVITLMFAFFYIEAISMFLIEKRDKVFYYIMLSVLIVYLSLVAVFLVMTASKQYSIQNELQQTIEKEYTDG